MSVNNSCSKKFFELSLMTNISSWHLDLRLYVWLRRSGKICLTLCTACAFCSVVLLMLNHVCVCVCVCVCCRKAGSRPQIDVTSFLEWMKLEPQSMVWIPVMHRLAVAEGAQHHARCAVCRSSPILGIRSDLIVSSNILANHFSGPHRALGLVCVCVGISG